MRWLLVFVLVVLSTSGTLGVTADKASEGVLSTQPATTPADPVGYPPALFDRTVEAPAIVGLADQDRNAHLQKAAEHLRAAGLNSLADHVAGLAAPPNDSPTPGDHRPNSSPQILFHFKLLELDADKIDRLGLDFEPVNPPAGASRHGSVQAVTNMFRAVTTKNVASLVDALRAEGLVRVLAEPTLVTVSGRPANFHAGGEVMVWGVDAKGEPISRPKKYGTLVDLTPRITDKGLVRLDLRFTHSALDPARTVTVAGRENPGIRETTLVTRLEMEPGKTFVLLGPSRVNDNDKTAAGRTRTTVMLVSAEMVAPLATSPRRNSSSSNRAW